MKNKNILVLSLFVFLTAGFIGCSKESPVSGDQSTSTAIKSNNNVTNNSSRLAPAHYGFIVGVLVPAPAKARIIAFNDQFVSEETTSKPDGSFELSNLIQGGYMIKIDYVPIGANDYSSMTISKVVVIAGNVTNLGKISLE